MCKFYLWAIGLFAGILTLDQLVKIIIEHTLKLHEAIELCSFFSIAYVRNQGAAWGMLQGAQYYLAAFGIVAILLLILFRKKVLGDSPWYIPVLGILCAGILGNIIDRIRLGYVVDMFDFYWGVHHFPCFNVADAAICLAVGWLFILQWREPK